MPAQTKAAKSNASIAVIGIDIALSRSQLENRLANIPPCLIGVEACVGAHHLSRQLIALGHDARLMLAKYVKAFLKGNKNDFPGCRGDRRSRAAANDAVRGDKDGRATRSSRPAPRARPSR
jgi:transposase